MSFIKMVEQRLDAFIDLQGIAVDFPGLFEDKAESLLNFASDLVKDCEAAERQLAECQQCVKEAEQLASNNWELVQGLNKHSGDETAARQAAEQERDRLIGAIEWLQGQAIDDVEPGWMSIPKVEFDQTIEQALGGAGK